MNLNLVDRIQVIEGDITQLAVDVIVNAASERLLGGGGVDGAIHAAAGPELLCACRAVPEVRPGVRCPTGEARITPGFGLGARFVVHTVGPVWHGGGKGEAAALASCYRESLNLAFAAGARNIAIPALSTGVFGYPREAAAAVAVSECLSFLAGHGGFERISLVAFGPENAAVLRLALHGARSGCVDA